MENVLALALEACGAVGHETLALRAPYLGTQVGLVRAAELAVPAPEQSRNNTTHQPVGAVTHSGV